MANKDFLSQFSTNNKPDSFKEEERIPVTNNKKPINPKFIIIGAISLLVIVALVVIIFIIPKIKVESFVGLKKEDAVAWIRQQGIETSGIIFKEEYDFDNEVGVVLSQDPESGKVNNKAKMTFVISKGPDPDEKIIVPDLKTMDKDSINAWIKENKLSSTRINSTYSDTVEENNFIEAKYSGCDEDTFTRGCTLKISVSKGV
ncbi:MAG: PASTA domain-containing protein, partial [Erysipelotrichaceae bacterium]|nr:PASTA domain-containing protein [Erysipelotrichaceae bacterium]